MNRITEITDFLAPELDVYARLTEVQLLNNEFPELAKQIILHIPDENSRRVGQSVAAASLPQLV